MAKEITNMERVEWLDVQRGDVIYVKGSWLWRNKPVFFKRWVVDPSNQQISSHRDLANPSQTAGYIYQHKTIGVYFQSNMDILSHDFDPRQRDY